MLIYVPFMLKEKQYGLKIYNYQEEFVEKEVNNFVNIKINVLVNYFFT